MHSEAITERLQAIESRLELVLNWLSFISHKETNIMALLDKLTADVTANGSVIDSAIVLLNGLKAKLDACGTDPVKLAELSASLGTQTSALSTAVAANTPVVGTPVVDTPPPVV